MICRYLQVRASLIRRAQESGEVGEKALLALKGLTIAAFQGDYEDVRNVLGLAAGKGRMPSQRIEVFRALWSAAVVSESPELFFGNTRIWPTVCESIEPTEPAEIRENVLGLLGALTQQATGPHFVWHDEGLREHLLTSTTRSQPSTVRSRALMALAGSFRNLSCFSIPLQATARKLSLSGACLALASSNSSTCIQHQSLHNAASCKQALPESPRCDLPFGPTCRWMRPGS